MISQEKPEIFYKEAFCKAVCGHTDHELIDFGRQAVSGIDSKFMPRGGRDMPRDPSEVVVDRLEVFMNTVVPIPLLDLSLDTLYESFSKFRDYERHIHPRDSFPHHEPYWGPTYEAAERAYQNGDETAFKEQLGVLIDKIMHD